MARPPLEVGSWGNIPAPREVSPGRFIASTYCRDTDGKRRRVEASGPSATKARQRLMGKLQRRQSPEASTITAESRLSAVVPLWWQEVEERGLAANSRTLYRHAVDSYLLKDKGGVGDLRVRECTTWRMDQFLQGIRQDHGPSAAKVAKTVLTGVLKTATRYGAITTNPLREVRAIPVQRKEVKALTRAEARELFADLEAWQGEERPTRRHTRADDLSAVADLMLATACRISEALAVRWQDVDLEAGTVEINGAVIYVRGKGLVRQGHAKNQGSHLVKDVAPEIVEMLRRRWDRMTSQGMMQPMVFPSATGTLRDPSNFDRQWRKAMREIGREGITPHTFRKTAATWIADATDLATASAYLGHANEAVTKAHYVAKSGQAADMTAVLSGWRS